MTPTGSAARGRLGIASFQNLPRAPTTSARKSALSPAFVTRCVMPSQHTAKPSGKYQPSVFSGFAAVPIVTCRYWPPRGSAKPSSNSLAATSVTASGMPGTNPGCQGSC